VDSKTVYKEVVFFAPDLETSFVMNELRNLSLNFEEVRVYIQKENVVKINFTNVNVITLNFKHYNTKVVLRAHFFEFLLLLVKEFFYYPKYLIYRTEFKSSISELLRAIFLADKIKALEKARTNKKIFFYTYWFNQWAMVLAILSKNKYINTFYSRAHGTDIYEHRVPVIKRLPFRWFQLKQVDKVLSVSRSGSNYLKEKYPAYSHKISTLRLGTTDYGVAPFNTEAVFTLVSCAKIRNIKRIHLIAEILQHTKMAIKWIHLGSENSGDPTLPLLRENLKRLERDHKNIEIDFRGELSNEEILKIYATESVNLFISVSETEGLPVSMMEAISFGIPILATDVGGCKEIVTSDTGILIPKDFDAVLVAEELERFAISHKNASPFRKGVRGFWEKNFQNNVNFASFITYLS
jgi:glycosyltransferase involved in cell wall biosynthesis